VFTADVLSILTEPVHPDVCQESEPSIPTGAGRALQWPGGETVALEPRIPPVPPETSDGDRFVPCPAIPTLVQILIE
jgi:hypothetical protein